MNKKNKKLNETFGKNSKEINRLIINFFNENNLISKNKLNNSLKLKCIKKFDHCLVDANVYSVIIPFCIIDDNVFILIEKRSAYVKQPLELSFPGGKKEDHENSMLDVALRECEEEIGLNSKAFSKIRFCGLFANLKTVIYVFAGLIKTQVSKKIKVQLINDPQNDLSKSLNDKKILSYSNPIENLLKINKKEVEKVILFPFELFLQKPYIFEINYKGHIQNLPEDENLKKIIENNYLKDGFYLPYTRTIRYWKYENEVLWGYSADIISSVVMKIIGKTK